MQPCCGFFKPISPIPVSLSSPNWEDFLPEFTDSRTDGFYVFPDSGPHAQGVSGFLPRHRPGFPERLRYHLLKFVHDRLFSFDAAGAVFFHRVSHWADTLPGARKTIHLLEGGVKKILLDCKQCGDCGIEHLAFYAPNPNVPNVFVTVPAAGAGAAGVKSIRNRYCVWVRTYLRLASTGEVDKMVVGCLPPRMWELNKTPSWLNFHLKRDHQSVSTDVIQRCRLVEGRLMD